MRKLLAATFALSLLGCPAEAAPALVASVAASSSNGTSVTTGAINNTGADFLVACVATDDTHSVTPSDSSSNTWTAGTAFGIASNEQIQMYYVASPTVSASQTFTVNAGANSYHPSIVVASFSGVATSSPADQSNGNDAASSSTLQPGSITPSLNGELLITCLGLDNPITGVSINDSFAITSTAAFTSGDAWASSQAYLVQATAAAINPTWTGWSGSQAPAASIVSFKATAAAGHSAPALGVGN